MKSIILTYIFFNFLGLTPPQSTFKQDQLRYSRVRLAYNEKEVDLKKDLIKKGITTFAMDIFIRAFKKEQVLEVWVKKKDVEEYILFKSFEFCSTSGEPGPKRKEGDWQIPEGFYHVEKFNPYSNFHLSLGINYPNRSDKVLGDQVSPGGEIYIHGDCVTIGCIPITDDKIKELYILAVEAKSSGQNNIPVHIFPDRLDNETFKELKKEFQLNKDFIKLWENLKEGYDHFEKDKKLPDVTIDKEGKYLFF